VFPGIKDKWRFQSFVSAKLYLDFLSKGKRIDSFGATKALIFYHRSISQKIFAKYPKVNIGLYEAIDYHGELIIIRGGFGIGAPAAVAEMEELIAFGIKEFISIGLAGSLTSELDIGDYLICSKSFRDEGTSYHYAAPEVDALADSGLVDKLNSAVTKSSNKSLIGASWTTDAPYRETKEEIVFYKNMDAKVVEMESSALYILAQIKQVRCASLFAISDILIGDIWQPKFDHKKINLEELSEMALKALVM
jgi:uridine phosphorylase